MRISCGPQKEIDTEAVDALLAAAKNVVALEEHEPTPDDWSEAERLMWPALIDAIAKMEGR